MSPSYDVAVLGCGLMGSALAKRFASAGLSVVAWNRTPARAEALEQHGVTPTSDVEHALRTARLVVVCMSDVGATRDTLEPVAELAGTTVVNLSDGSPDDIVQLGAWLRQRGANLLDGATLCYPEQIGRPGAMVVFSGPGHLWADHGDTLMLLGGGSRYLSDSLSDAKALYIGTSAFFVNALSGFVEAASFLLHRGRSLDEIKDGTLYVLELLGYATEIVAAAMAAGAHDTDQASIHVFADGSRKILAELERAGIESSVSSAAARKLIAAEKAGLGLLGFSAQSELTPGGVPAS